VLRGLFRPAINRRATVLRLMNGAFEPAGAGAARSPGHEVSGQGAPISYGPI